MARELAARLPGLTAGLQATGAGAAHPLSAQELCETIRVAYDPAAATLIDDAHADGDVPDLRWSDVGPTAAQAGWDGYRHDSAKSVTWAMTQAPRGLVQSGVLARLLAWGTALRLHGGAQRRDRPSGHRRYLGLPVGPTRVSLA